MVWWISGALVVGSLVVLALAVAVVARRVGQLNIVVRRLRLRLAEVERSALPKITALQEGVAALEGQVLVAQERAELLKAKPLRRRDS